MEFLEKLLARARKAPPLKAGSFSGLAAQARSEQWIEQCIGGMSTQETKFATSLLMRALQSAELLVGKVEAEESLLAFFAGTSRDILLFEILFFCLHGLSDQMRRIAPPDNLDANVHFSDLAFMAAGKLGSQHLGNFDASRHRFERAKTYLHCIGKPEDMSDCLIDILLRTRGRMSIQQPDDSPRLDTDIDVQISLHSIVHSAGVASIFDGAEKLARHYAEKFDRALYERERSLGL